MWLYIKLPDGREVLVNVVSVTVTERALIYRPVWAPGSPVELSVDEFEVIACMTVDNACMFANSSFSQRFFNG